MNEQKNALRAEKSAALKSIKNRKNRENRAADAVLFFIENGGFKKIAIYVSVRDELDTREIIRRLLLTGKRVFVPVCERGKGEMFFTEAKPRGKWVIGEYGIPEPEEKNPEKEVDVIFVPLVAFDGDKNRLGKGKGYYDRLLSTSKAKKIGLAFSEQETDLVPTEPTDVKLDEILVF